jgi:hypothetical protein
MAKSDSKFPPFSGNGHGDSRHNIKGKELKSKFKQSDNKKYKDDKLYNVTLTKGGDIGIDIRGEYKTFTARKTEKVKGKFLNHNIFKDQENFFSISEA